MLKEFNLKDFTISLQSTHIQLNISFLNKLLKVASKSLDPHKNKTFCNCINCPINKNKGVSTTVYGWMKGYRTIPFSKLVKIMGLTNFSWKELEQNLISIKSGIRKGEVYPVLPIHVDKDLGLIIGHIMGDGSIEKRFHSVFYSNSNLELLNEFSTCMKKIFGISPRIWVQDKPKFGETRWLKKLNNLNNIPNGHNVGLFYPKICSDILYTLFGKFAEGKNKIISKEILDSNINFKGGFIRAFFDDEGSVSSKNYTIRFHQDKEDILKGIIKMLKERDINSNPIRYYIKQNKLRYYFNITRFEEYSKFYEIIGCTSSNKQREFELLISGVKKNQYSKKI